MKFSKKFLFVLVLVCSFFSTSYAELPYYLDFKLILNESVAGKKAQNELQKKLNTGLKSLNSREKKIREEEKQIIGQKKLIDATEYKKKVSNLRQKVSQLQKDKSSLIEKVAKERSKARNELLKNLNPIIKEYMKEKKIRYVMDKKSLILADESLDITNDIIKKLNAKLKEIKLN